MFWDPMLNGKGAHLADDYIALMKRLGAQGVGYVPCPRCLVERNFVAVKSCACNVPRVTWERGRRG
jgi:hypothetical protein